MTLPELEAAQERLRPLEEARNRSEWNLYADATDEHEAAAVAAGLAFESALADPALRETALRARAAAVTAIDQRVAALLDLATEPAQRPPDLLQAIIELESALASRMSGYRATYQGRELSDNDVDQVLVRSSDVDERQAVWESARAVGAEVADDLRALVRLRNDAAQRLGARDHYALSLRTSEIDEGWLMATLDELEARLAPVVTAERDAIDDEMRARFGLGSAEPLYPWHYTDRFFQAPPPTHDPLEHVMDSVDIIDACRRYFLDLGHDVDAILGRSDLYPRERKHQHAFCSAITRDGDARISCNIASTPRWLETTLHELGHAIYEGEVERSLPWLLRTHSHLLTTEAIAMLHGGMSRDRLFLEHYAGLPPEIARHPANAAAHRRFLLVFGQWVQVMVRFEQALYRDPDGDLDTIWWDLAARYQRLTRPADRRPHDWASKTHLTTAPVYYHNYLLGEVTVAQLQAALERETGARSPAEYPAAAGALLAERVMRPGASLRWDELIEHATGAPLSVDAYVAALGG